MASCSTRKNAIAVRSLVVALINAQQPSRTTELSSRIFGKILTSNPPISNNKLGLSAEYTHTNVSTPHSIVVSERGNRFRISQNVARPKLTSAFINRILQSLGQHFLLLYPTTFSLLGSGCSVKYRCTKSRDSSALIRNTIYIRSTYRMYNRTGCRVSVSTSANCKNAFGDAGGPASSVARCSPSSNKSITNP
ncbi:hypothetical protein AX774_g4025 [Zancudomyces culisetae]|uniref:Uncharacterized protein n=1 Tax=Zancudomyces culisetae TaxID=1213189 RepID=A0A1R1PNH1_ZANCU|nr:hypothetical protein AX774_g4025 [Zancudomyces culisetae]|eukprot:OMH82498.1 hypothetical protein AX774_g4025 [Zancudomyces culisetae]